MGTIPTAGRGQRGPRVRALLSSIRRGRPRYIIQSIALNILAEKCQLDRIIAGRNIPSHSITISHRKLKSILYKLEDSLLVEGRNHSESPAPYESRDLENKGCVKVILRDLSPRGRRRRSGGTTSLPPVLSSLSSSVLGFEGVPRYRSSHQNQYCATILGGRHADRCW